MQSSGNTILVTGASSGIGRELARRLHDLGNVVIAAGRRREALEETCDGRADMHVMTFDAMDQASITALAKDTVAQFPALNGLINNAGIMKMEMAAEEGDLTNARDQITTNLIGPIALVNALVEHLKAQNNAFIANVTSGLAFVPIKFGAVYSATKAGLHNYTVSLREALRGKVEVIDIVPPGVRTDLTPGQRDMEMYMPLDEFIDETMSLLTQSPTPPEILVENVKFLRNAEREGRFDQTLAMLNPA